ncbi:type IV secretion system DNA-binding domain-containing protein [Natronococcus sp. JC468]|nr:type IV secretion system DNA-binding domain-containing protein [Natronococcus sp. JC468]
MLTDIGDLFRTVEPTADNFAIPIEYRGGRADDVSIFSNAVQIPRRSLLAIGTSGAGKSEFLKHIVEQLRTNPTEPTVVFDMKEDYQDMLEARGADIIRISADASDYKWNLFAELEDESDVDEIARGIFPGDDGDQFFTNAGRQLFAATVKYIFREVENPTNADLKRYWERTDAETMYEDLSSDGHEDLTAAASAIDPNAGRQASGVYSTAQQQVSDLLVGDFGRDGAFSIREYMANPQGRILVLDYPNRQASTIAPLFAFLIDEAIKHGMDVPDRSAYFLLDEIEHLDVTIDRLSELINVGRGRGCQAIITLQSVAQLYDTYSKERGRALLSGMTTAVILRVADSDSVEFARSRIGTHFEEFTHRERPDVGFFGSEETKLEEQHDFAKGEFTQFEPGEAVICRQSKGWVHAYVPMLEVESSDVAPEFDSRNDAWTGDDRVMEDEQIDDNLQDDPRRSNPTLNRGE